MLGRWSYGDQSRKREGSLGYRTVAGKAQRAGGTGDLSARALEKVRGTERGNKLGGPEELTCWSSCMLGEGIHLAIDGNRPEVLHDVVVSCIWGIRPRYEDRPFVPQASPWPDWRPSCFLRCFRASMRHVCRMNIKDHLVWPSISLGLCLSWGCYNKLPHVKWL